MSKAISLTSHIDQLLTKIASDKKAGELGKTSVTAPGGNGDTKSIPDGGTYSDLDKQTASTVSKASAPENSNPGGEHAGSVKQLTPDEAGDTPKKGKDVGETSGPKAQDQGAGKSASALADDLLKSIADLVKSASAPAAEGTDAKKAEKSVEKAAAVSTDVKKDETAEDVIKQAAEKHPEALKAGYEFASKFASLLVTAEKQEQAAQSKIASEAEDDATKVAEFLMGFAKTAGEDISALLGGGAPAGDMGGLVPPEAALGGGAAIDPAAGGAPAGLDAGMGGDPMGGGQPSQDQIVQALADALQQAGVSPEELAAALASETGGGDPAAAGGAPAPEAPAAGGAPEKKEESAPAEKKEEAPEKKEEPAEKEAALRKTAGYKSVHSEAVNKIAALKAKGLLGKKK